MKTPSGETFSFDVDGFRKHCLLNGLDDIGVTLEDADAIRAYEEKRRISAPGCSGTPDQKRYRSPDTRSLPLF